MADVKWIKIVTDLFDDEKILMIETMPEADTIIVLWFKLLCLAGKQNNSGVFMFNDRIPYTDEMFATIFRRNINTVRLALETFEKFGMIEMVNGAATIPNWSKHQTLDQLEERKEYMREYMKKYREKQKEIAAESNCKASCKVNSKANVNSLEEDKKKIRKEKEKDSILTSPSEKVDYVSIAEEYNLICFSLPKCQKLSDSRKRSIKIFLKEFTRDELTTVFEKAQASTFLRDGNGTWKGATFDWLLNKKNALKVLEGNYDDNGNEGMSQTKSALKDWFAESEEIIIE